MPHIDLVFNDVSNIFHFIFNTHKIHINLTGVFKIIFNHLVYDSFSRW